MNKKAELTTQQIIVLIILIASFAVLLFFIFKINLGRETDKEICHNSVVMRAHSFLSTESIPLKCKREYVCITADGTCEKMTNPVLEKVDNQEDIFSILADRLTDCWWMFGEGEINYVGKNMFPELYCSICAQIAFDDSVSEEVFNGETFFSKGPFYEYLTKQEMRDGRTYAEYLEVDKVLKLNQNFGSIELDKQYYILTGTMSERSNAAWILGGAAAAVILVGGLILTPVTGGLSLGSAIGIISVAAGGVAGGISGAVGGEYVASFIKGRSGLDYVSPELIEVNSKKYKDIGCESISTLS